MWEVCVQRILCTQCDKGMRVQNWRLKNDNSHFLAIIAQISLRGQEGLLNCESVCILMVQFLMIWQGEIMTTDEKYMKAAIREAGKAYALSEVPIGCVIVHEDRIIGRGYNRRTVDKNVLSHAEISAIKKACKKIGDWRLEECTLYVTLEPCPMCAGAIVQARISRVVMGSMNPKAGCAGSVINLLDEKGFNHQVELEHGVLGDACSEMLKTFFKELRQKKQSHLDK